MRQVRSARPRSGAAETRRDAARAPARRSGRTSAASGRGDLRSGGFWGGVRARLFAPLAALFSLKHPLFLTGFALAVLVLVLAILATGVIGRTVRAVNETVAAAVVHSGFGIAAVTISGTRHVSNADVRAALGFAPGEPTFMADLYEARERVLRLPWVADVSVRRRYPGAIDVTVTEKVPFARWQTYGGTFIVDAAGGVITTKGADAFARLPLLWGASAPKVAGEMVAAVQAHPLIARHVLAYHYQSERRWNLVLSNGMVVKLPEFGWQKELDELDRMIAERHVLDRNLSSIDLRAPNYYYFDDVKEDNPSEKPADKPAEEGRAI